MINKEVTMCGESNKIFCCSLNSINELEQVNELLTVPYYVDKDYKLEYCLFKNYLNMPLYDKDSYGRSLYLKETLLSGSIIKEHLFNLDLEELVNLEDILNKNVVLELLTKITYKSGISITILKNKKPYYSIKNNKLNFYSDITKAIQLDTGDIEVIEKFVRESFNNRDKIELCDFPRNLEIEEILHKETASEVDCIDYYIEGKLLKSKLSALQSLNKSSRLYYWLEESRITEEYDPYSSSYTSNSQIFIDTEGNLVVDSTKVLDIDNVLCFLKVLSSITGKIYYVSEYDYVKYVVNSDDVLSYSVEDKKKDKLEMSKSSVFKK